MHIDQLALNVSNNTEGDKEVFLDPLTLYLIATIISTLFKAAKLYCEMNTANEMRAACTNSSLLQRRMIKRTISDCDINNLLTYDQQQEVAKSILQTGASTTIHALELALDEDDCEYGEWEV